MDMNAVNQNKLGLVLGGFVGLAHLVWIILVGIGVAQPLMDFVFRLHSIAPVYQVAPLTLKHAVGLIILTTVGGYIAGWVIGWIWNKVHKAA
jgi:hypothetical protein